MKTFKWWIEIVLTMNYLYSVGYHTYEESDYRQLCHERKFSQQEFEDIVTRTTAKIIKEYSKSERITFQDVLWSVVKELEKDGFQQASFAGKFHVFGWADIRDKKDWKSDREVLLNKLTDATKKPLQKRS
ncbi:Uncharacterised protein [uncultured archaeon]|nr:Uncharacterised protein [uncultured archaeon]